MNLRTKVPLLAISILLSTTLVFGVILLFMLRVNMESEAKLRAKTFLDALAVSATEDLATGRIDSLDRMVTTLTDYDLEQLDVRFVQVLSPERRVIAHSKQFYYGRVADDEFSIEAVNADEPILRDAYQNKERILMVSRPLVTQIDDLPGIRWGTLTTALGLDRLQRMMAHSLIGIITGVVLASILSAALLISLLNTQLIKPLDNLTEAAASYGHGNLGTRARIYGKDEISMLATTFNQMADTVENHTRNLEFQILERTHELQSANKLLADLNERLNELAITDGLTGLFNFRQFQDTIRKELVRAKRLRIPFSLLAMDVDFFKQFNDTYGHPSGDIALKKLASVMKERLRESDILCRIGGEEFAAILPGTWHEAAIGLAQELRMSLEKSELINEAGQKIPGITISVGVATFPDHADNVSDLINAADSALYLAKQRGRSQVASAANISKIQG